MPCSNCARIIRTTGRVPPHFLNKSTNRQTCPEPGGGKYAETIRKQRLAELPGKYRETKRKLEEANNTIRDVQKELDSERKRVRIPEDSTCPICLDAIKDCDTDSGGFIKPVCNHIIHTLCYTKMVSRHLSGFYANNPPTHPIRCPTCRETIIPDNSWPLITH